MNSLGDGTQHHDVVSNRRVSDQALKAKITRDQSWLEQTSTYSSQSIEGKMVTASLCSPYERSRSRCYDWEEERDKDHIFLACNDKTHIAVRWCWSAHLRHRLRRRTMMIIILDYTVPWTRRSLESRGVCSFFRALPEPDDWRLLELKLNKHDHCRWTYTRVVGTNRYRRVQSSRWHHFVDFSTIHFDVIVRTG